MAGKFAPGDGVVYRPYPDAPPEQGTVVRVGETLVFVHYDGDPHHLVKATRPQDLTLMSEVQ